MQKTFQLYYTSDTHGRLFPEKSSSAPCLSSAFTEYQKDTNTLVLDGGDTLQGSPLLRYLWKTNQCAEVLPAVMNSSGMDYYTLGNHDFNYGYAGLAGYVRAMNATCVCANVKDTTADKLDIRPYVIHTLGNGLRVGIVGIVTDWVNVWEAKENLEGLQVTDAFTAAKEALTELKSVENTVDYTICIYHGGFEESLQPNAPVADAVASSQSSAPENIACKICKELAFDLLLTAHQHMEQTVTELYGTAVLQLPPNAEKYAKLEIAVGGMDKSCKRILRAQHIKPTAAPSEALLLQMQPYRCAAAQWLAQPAGSLANDVPAQLDKIALALGAAPLAQLANFAQLNATGAEVAITSLPNDACALPQAFTVGELLTAYPFPNAVMTLAVKGEVLAKGIARSASYFAKAPSGDLQVASHFTQPKEEHYNYDFFAGVSYTISFEGEGVTTPTVTEILVNGEPLDLARTYTVAMSDYRATGTGGYPFYADCPCIASHPMDLQALLLDTLAQHPQFEIPVLSQVKVARG